MNAITKCLVAALLAAPACSSSVDDLSSGKLADAGSAGAAGTTPQTGGKAGQSGATGVSGSGGAGAAGAAGASGMAGSAAGVGGSAEGGLSGAAGTAAGTTGSGASGSTGNAGDGGATAGGAAGANTAGAAGTTTSGFGGAAGANTAGAGGDGGTKAGGAAGTNAAGTGGAAGTNAAGTGGAAGTNTAGTGGAAGANTAGTGGAAGTGGSAGSGGGFPAICGNGVVETGEECDIIGIPGAGAPTCNILTCRRDCTGEQRYRDTISGACFFVPKANAGSGTTYNWADAKTACTSFDARLATFEDDALRNRVAARKWESSQLWVGGRQDTGSGSVKPNERWFWQTPAGPIAIASDIWQPGEPNDGISLPFDSGNQDCAHVYPNDEFRLDDVGCNTKRAALCVVSPKQ